MPESALHVDTTQTHAPQPFTVEYAGATDIGCVRSTNQDNFGLEPDAGLLIVCDGMGGAAGGEVASEAAVDRFVQVARKELPPRGGEPEDAVKSALRRAVAAANFAVLERAEADPSLEGMGSTLVAAHWTGERITVINVGDSRAYLFWAGAARQITRDHSLVAEQVREGYLTAEEAERSHLRSVITRAVGVDEDPQPDVFVETVGPGDVLLLCSDGLTRHLDANDIAAILGEATLDAQGLCDALIALARERGGSDNITVAILRITGRT